MQQDLLIAREDVAASRTRATVVSATACLQSHTSPVSLPEFVEEPVAQTEPPSGSQDFELFPLPQPETEVAQPWNNATPPVAVQTTETASEFDLFPMADEPQDAQPVDPFDTPAFDEPRSVRHV